MTPDDSRLFIAELNPRLGAYLARRHESGYDAVAGRARFLLWLAAHAEGTSAVADYLARADRSPWLTAEEEASLATRMRAGERAASRLADGGGTLADPALAELERAVQDGTRAGDELLEANLRLVTATARRFAGRGVPFLDLIQAGHAGLVQALREYDPAKGYRFSTYATWWIRQAITRIAAGRASATRAPAPEAAGGDLVARAERRMLQALGREPSPEELAADLDPL